MTTVPDSGERIGQEQRIPTKASISRDEFGEDSLKIVSLPPLENDSFEEISLKKQVISSPITSVSNKDGEMIHSSSIEVSISETEAMSVDCLKVLSFPETVSAFLEDDKVCGELHQIEETYASNFSLAEISKEGDGYGDDVHKIEEVDDTNGAIVSISEAQGFVQGKVVTNRKESLKLDKKGQDSDAQRLLEAEKRRLLAEVEVGTIFRKRVDVESLTDANKIEKDGNFSKENAFVERSVKIELIDDTALVDVVSFYKKAKDHNPKRPVTARTEKDAPRKHKKFGEKPTNASKVAVRNASNGKQVLIMYSRNQMESMRYAHMANQKKLWSDLYARLLPELVTEYEGLVSWKNHNTSNPNLRDSGIGILDLGTKERIDDLTLEEDYVVEEEYIEDNDDYNSILKPAFEVDGEPDFDSGPPEDGLEYLRRVRWEAKGIPNVKVAKIDESKYIKKEQSVYMPQIPEISKCPEHLLPVKEWEDSLLSEFLRLQLALSQNANKCEDEMIMPSQSIEDVLMDMFNKRLHTERNESFGGIVSDIQGIDLVTRVSKLRKCICLVENESSLQRSDCKWIVALYASVETPLDADTCACLRALVRKCASLRAEVEDEQVIIMANMIITIVGRYFGQMEVN